MFDKIFEKSSQSLWKKLGEKALDRAVTTFVEHGVKAVIDVWKDRYMEEWKADFRERQKARKEEAGDKPESQPPNAP